MDELRPENKEEDLGLTEDNDSNVDRTQYTKFISFFEQAILALSRW